MDQSTGHSHSAIASKQRSRSPSNISEKLASTSKGIHTTASSQNSLPLPSSWKPRHPSRLRQSWANSSPTPSTPPAYPPLESIVFVPGSIPLPLVTAHPLDFDPSHDQVSILSRETDREGHIFYVVAFTNTAGTKKKLIQPEHILDHVSSLRLEQFETRLYLEESVKRAEESNSERELDRARGKLPQVTSIAPDQSYDTAEGLRTLRPRQASATSTSSSSDSLKSKSSDTNKPSRPRKKRKRKITLDLEYEVEAILDDGIFHKTQRKNGEYERRYLVKWVGWPAEESTWEPIQNLGGAEELLKKYWVSKDVDARDVGDHNDNDHKEDKVMNHIERGGMNAKLVAMNLQSK